MRLEKLTPPVESVCGKYVVCGTCLTNSKCGWCNEEQKCVDGDDIGPLGKQCKSYNYKFCQGQACYAHQKCGSCIANHECGWCQDEANNGQACV